MDELTDLRGSIQQLAAKYGKSMAQICVNWAICHGAIPLVGIRSLEQARDAVGALGWKLDQDTTSESFSFSGGFFVFKPDKKNGGLKWVEYVYDISHLFADLHPPGRSPRVGSPRFASGDPGEAQVEAGRLRDVYLHLGVFRLNSKPG